MTFNHLGRAALAAMTAAAALAAGPASAQALGFRYWGEISGFRPSIDATSTVSRPGAPGADIDMENDLGLNKHETLPSVLLGAKVFKRWFIVGEAFPLDRDGSRTLARDIVFDGATYPAGATVESELRSDVYRLSVGYNFIQTDKAELGVALGLHATDFKVALEGDVRVGAATLRPEAHAKDFVAPLPTLGVVAAYEVAPKVVLSGRLDYFSLKYKDYDGSIFNAQVAVGYRITDNFEVGAAWRYVDYGLDVEKDTYTANVDYDFNGPAIYLRAGLR